MALRSVGDPVLYLTTPAGVDAETRRTMLDGLAKLNQKRLAEQGDPEIAARIAQYEMAFKMQTAVPGLMDLGKESPATLQAYGIGNSKTDDFARQCLYARKFAEAGVRFIEIGTGGWDHHKNLRDEMSESAGGVDQPIAALLADLKQRDMLKDTLLVWAGEFGRTPFAQGSDGRDHNPFGFTIWFAGGGIKGGVSFGATDDFGYRAVENRQQIHDLHATMLHLLGIDHTQLTFRHQGRPFRLTDVHGEVVRRILG